MEVSQGIVAFSQCRAQTGGAEAGGHEIDPKVVAVGYVDGGVEFDQGIARLDLLPVLDVDCANDTGLERLNDLGSATRDDLALGGRHNINPPEDRPGERQAEDRDDRAADREAGRRGRRFHDL